MMKSKITDKQRANLTRAKNHLSAAAYDALVADAQAALVAMDEMNEKIYSLRGPGHAAHDSVPAGVLPEMLELVLAQAEREREVIYEWRGLFPVQSYDWRVETITIPIWSSEGMAAWYYGGGNHPTVTAGMRKISISMRTESLSYSIDWFDAQRESFAGVQSETEKVARVYKGLDAFASDVIFEGSTEAGFAGFIEHPNIADGELPYGAWDASAADPDEIYADIIYAVDMVYSMNDGVEGFGNMKVTVWLSPSMYRIANSAIKNTFSNETVMQLAMKDPRIAAIKSVTKLGTTAGGANDYMIVGVFELSEVALPIGADAMRLPVKDLGYFIEQPFVTTLGAVHVKRPLSFFRATGLNE